MTDALVVPPAGGVRAFPTAPLRYFTLRELADAVSGLHDVRKMVFIVVNSQVEPEFGEDSTPNTPGLLRQLSAIVDIPIHRYSSASMQTLRSSIEGWKREVAAFNASRPPSEQRPIEFYVIDVSAESAADVPGTHAMRDIATVLRLSAPQLETVRRVARQRLAADPDFQRLLFDLNGSQSSEILGAP